MYDIFVRIKKFIQEEVNETFPNRWIGRGGPIAWPARSPDLNPLDFFLWGHMKSIVYAQKSDSEHELLHRIMIAAREIINSPRTLENAVASLNRRTEMCINNGGGHFEQLL